MPSLTESNPGAPPPICPRCEQMLPVRHHALDLEYSQHCQVVLLVRPGRTPKRLSLSAAESALAALLIKNFGRRTPRGELEAALPRRGRGANAANRNRLHSRLGSLRRKLALAGSAWTTSHDEDGEEPGYALVRAAADRRRS